MLPADGRVMAKDNTKKTQEEIKEKPADEAELEELKRKNEELEMQVKRVLADYQNLQKRTEGERGEIIKMANRELLLHLLPALDTLILAGKHVDDEGVKLSIAQF